MLEKPHAPPEPASIPWLHAVVGALLDHQMMLGEDVQQLGRRIAASMSDPAIEFRPEVPVQRDRLNSLG